jgi:hypothetical protein
MTRPVRPDLAPVHVVTALDPDRIDHVRLELAAVTDLRRHLAREKAAGTRAIAESMGPRDPSGGLLMRWVARGVHTRMRRIEADEIRIGVQAHAILGAENDRTDAIDVEIDLCDCSSAELAATIGDEASPDAPWTIAATAEACLDRLSRSMEAEPPRDYVSTLRGLAWESHAALGLPDDVAIRIHAPSRWSRAAISIDIDHRTGATSPWSEAAGAYVPDQHGIEEAVRIFISGNPSIRSARTLLDPWSVVVDPARDGPIARLRDLAALADARSRT